MPGRRLGFLMNADKTLNYLMLFRGEFEPNDIGVERLFTLGSIASSPLVMNGAVYFGSADGYLYAPSIGPVNRLEQRNQPLGRTCEQCRTGAAVCCEANP
jgi:hypothetical protein